MQIPKNNKEEILKNSLKSILLKQDLTLHQDFIQRLSSELQISILDCAAALTVLNQPDLYTNRANHKKQKTNDKKGAIELPQSVTKPKVVRYRLDIGRKHKVTLEQIKNMLVEVSGVERKKIGWVDIRNYYTLVELPDGMPADIFQLLSEVEINNQKLNLKRIKQQRKFYRRNNKKRLAQQGSNSNSD